MIVKVTIPNGQLSEALESELTQLGLKVTRGMASIFLDGELGLATDGAKKIEQAMTSEWDGFPSQLDLLAATIYNVSAQSPREMTPERWSQTVLTLGAFGSLTALAFTAVAAGRFSFFALANSTSSSNVFWVTFLPSAIAAIFLSYVFLSMSLFLCSVFPVDVPIIPRSWLRRLRYLVSC